MGFDIRWIIAAYKANPNRTEVAVPESAKDRLIAMGDDLAGESGQAVIYIPKTTGRDKKFLGRIATVIRLLEMPEGSTYSDYGHRDEDHTIRWPFGWPCEVVSAPAPKECPFLEHLVHEHLPNSTFREFAGELHIGPVQLTRRMREALNSTFERISNISI